MTETSTTTATQAQALLAAAEFIDAHPDLPAPYVTSFNRGEVDLNYYLHINARGTLAEQKATAAAIVRAVGGDWEKQPWGEEFRFKTTRGPLTFDIQVQRDAVCERVVVGTETVTLPATDAQVIEAQPERTEVREVVEWRCAPLLADDAPADDEDDDPTPLEQWEVTTPAAVYATGDELGEEDYR
ncbi:hypothetical protein [Nocardioides sp. SYSU DS0663]|uniref:hypothetical protein n=1 Tax=Nocardioides sp. SYSU DS0663 TaxID=3416445 RepID=UPI003F4C7A62